MDRILLGLGAAGAALLIVAIAVAWWEHWRHMKEIRQQLAWSENTRALLQAHATDVENRLSALTAVVNSQRLAQAATAANMAQQGDPAAASAVAASKARQAARAEKTWTDTEPMVLKSTTPDFDPTMPAELSDH